MITTPEIAFYQRLKAMTIETTDRLEEIIVSEIKIGRANMKRMNQALHSANHADLIRRT